MEQRTRSILLGAVAVIAAVLIGVWWWSGFTLDFMRFFAAEPTTQNVIGIPERSLVPLPSRTSIGIIGCQNLPPGCTCQQVECFQAPCDPIVVCPSSATGMVSCSPATQTVRVGDQANLTATGGGGTYVWFFPEGARIGGILVGDSGTSAGGLSVRYDTPGVKKVTVQSARGDNINTDSVACTVVVQP